MEKVVKRINDYLVRPFLSLAKVAIRSRRPSASSKGDRSPLVIMGNGPSLRSYIDGGESLRQGCA